MRIDYYCIATTFTGPDGVLFVQVSEGEFRATVNTLVGYGTSHKIECFTPRKDEITYHVLMPIDMSLKDNELGRTIALISDEHSSGSDRDC